MGNKQGSETHSHIDFQEGRKHSIDRKHRGAPSPEMHQNLAPTKHEIREGIPVRKGTAVRAIDPERMTASENYRIALASIPIEKLYGHQLEVMGICGKCRGTLYHGMDGHYHMRSLGGSYDPICCNCVEGKPCLESWTKMPHLREKIKSIVEVIENKRYYWACKCGHKWRNKNLKRRPCSECGSKVVKAMKPPKEKVS